MLTRAFARLRAHRLLAGVAGRAGGRRRPPVIYVPGILGTKLHDRQCGVDLWGDYRGLLLRRPEEADFALDPADPQRILAHEALHEFRIVPGLVSSIITRDVVNALEVGLGYRLGRDLSFLAYDWRADYRQLGALLELEIRRLQARLGDSQQVIVIGQSIANMAIRYWLRTTTPALRESIAKWYAFGPPWRGSWNAVHMLQHGYWPASRRFHGFSAAAVATYASVYQLLPADSGLLDRNGVVQRGFDIFDASHWPQAGLPDLGAPLAGQLAQAREFSQALAGVHAGEAAVPQTWFVNDANLAVTAALQGAPGEAVATTVPAIRRRAPDLLARCCEIGDDHFPLRHISAAPCGPLVAAPEAVPWGDNYVLVGRAHDHRALINHAPNLRALVQDIAALPSADHPRNP